MSDPAGAPRSRVQELGGGRLLVDLRFREQEHIIGTYLLPEEEGWALVEVGPTTCSKRLLQGLSDAGVEPNEVRDVFLSHIHLDHAGGAGILADHLPRATFFVHESGAPHLIDPRKLQESARRAWGPACDELWGEIKPLPPERIRAVHGGESVPLAHGGSLQLLATPGHARHHLAFFDVRGKTIFTGDGAGVLLPGARHNRPGLPPPDLDLELLFGSLDRMAATGANSVAFSHYGLFDHAPERLRQARAAVERWRDVALQAARTSPTVADLVEALRKEELRQSREEGEPEEETAHALAVNGYELAAMGLLRYFERTGALGPSSAAGKSPPS